MRWIPVPAHAAAVPVPRHGGLPGEPGSGDRVVLPAQLQVLENGGGAARPRAGTDELISAPDANVNMILMRRPPSGRRGRRVDEPIAGKALEHAVIVADDGRDAGALGEEGVSRLAILPADPRSHAATMRDASRFVASLAMKASCFSLSAAVVALITPASSVADTRLHSQFWPWHPAESAPWQIALQQSKG